MVLPVKVLIDKTTHLAHTVDITGAGARLGGLQALLQIGTVVILHRGSKRAKFRIQWTNQIGPGEVQAGVECLEPQDSFWGVDLANRERKADQDMKALMTLLSGSSKSKL